MDPMKARVEEVAEKFISLKEKWEADQFLPVDLEEKEWLELEIQLIQATALTRLALKIW